MRSIFSFEGRASSKHFLWVFAPSASWALIFPIFDLSTRGPGGRMTWLTFFAACVWFASLYLSGAALARRIHDTGRSARFLLVLPLAFGIFDAVGQDLPLRVTNTITLSFMAIIALSGLALARVPSDPESNEFGLAPGPEAEL